MASRSFGGTVKLQGESEYRKALSQITDNLKVLSSEMKIVTSQYDKSDKSTENLSKQNEILNKKIKEQKEIVAQLSKALEDAKKETGDNSTTTKKWQTDLNNAKAELNKLEKSVDDNTKSINDFGNSEEEATDKTLKLGDVIKGHLISDAIKSGLKAVANGMKKLVSSFEDWSDMSNALKEQETKLTRVMKNTTNATDEQIKSIIDLTAQQEKLGVVSQETQLAGLQELGTYVTQKQSIEKLLPVMNDMIAQQYGIGASMESASGIATMLGKVLGNGQVDALSRLGYKFDDTQKEVLKFGTEEEKVAMLSDIITQSVGGMNKALSQTDAGQMEIAKSVMDDYKKTAGETYTTIKNKLVLALSKSLIPTLKKATDGFKQWASSVDWDKVSKKIKSALDKVISVFKWFIDNRHKFITVIGSMLSAFAVAKIASFVGTFSNFLTGVKTAGSLLPTVTKLLEKLNLTALANPYVALATGIMAVGTAMTIWINTHDKLTEAQRKEIEELEKHTNLLNDNVDSWNDLKQSRQDYLDNGMSELTHYENLYDELKSIVDENGKVKDGYEERAGFITSTLSEALGVEIEMTDGVISNYKKLTDSIDKVIEKKKADIILSSQEELYAEAIKKQKDAIIEMDYWEEKISNNKKKRDELELERKEQLEIRKNVWDTDASQRASHRLKEIKKEIEELDKETESHQKNYDKQLSLYEEYAYNKAVYEKNSALAHEERYDEMIQMDYNYNKKFEESEDRNKAILEDSIKYEEENLQRLLNLKEKSNTDLYDNDIESGKKRIESLKKQLNQYLETTKESLDNVELEWKDSLAEQLSEITGSNVKFKEASDGNMEMYVNGILSGKSKSKEEMAKLVSDTINEISKQVTGSEDAGKNLIMGINNGISNQSLQSSVFKSIKNFGLNILSKLKNSLQEHSPSKATDEMGQFLDKGIVQGMKKQSKNVLNETETLGNSVLGTLRGSLGEKLTLNKINISSELRKPTVNGLTNKYNVYQDKTLMVNAFKQALSEVKVVMNSREMGQFVTNTVEKEVFS